MKSLIIAALAAAAIGCSHAETRPHDAAHLRRQALEGWVTGYKAALASFKNAKSPETFYDAVMNLSALVATAPTAPARQMARETACKAAAAAGAGPVLDAHDCWETKPLAGLLKEEK